MDKYNYFSDLTSNLNKFLDKNKDIIDRCVFDLSWTHENGLRYDTFVVHFFNEKINKSYDLEQNKRFFEIYEVGKNIGFWQGELYDKIIRLIREEYKDKISTSSSFGVEKKCFVYSAYESEQNIKKIAKTIQEKIGLKTKIVKIAKASYSIFIHKDESFFKEIVSELKKEECDKKQKNEIDIELENKKNKLLRELEKIEKQIKKSKTN